MSYVTEFMIKDAAFSVEHDPQGRFWNSRWNLHEEVLAQYSLPKTVTITDSTIREGEEAPHVVYHLEDKLRITRLLDEMNVHEIDCGFASINQGHLDFLKALKTEGLRIRKSAIARIDLPDYKKGIDRILEAGADIVLCALYPTPLPGYDWSDYCHRVQEVIHHCKKSGVSTSFWFTCTRWDEWYALDLYRAAIDAGADRIKTAGGGVLTVPAYKRLVGLLIGIACDAAVGIAPPPDGRSTKTFKFENTREGLDTHWGMIMASKNRFNCNEVIVGYESTGPYGEPLLHYLMKKSVRVVQVNPMHTKRVKEINDNSPLKTDEKDPRAIADSVPSHSSARTRRVARSAPPSLPSSGWLCLNQNVGPCF